MHPNPAVLLFSGISIGYSLLLFSGFFIDYSLATGTNGQTQSSIDFGTFADPSSNLRARFRYWVPDASVNFSQIAEDIKDAGRIGAGGVEILPYYNYGDFDGDIYTIGTDWTKYGWGTPAWRELQDTALRATKEAGLVIDLALGPNQGAGVPAPVDTDGLQWDLASFNATIPIGGVYDAVLPGWGSGKLVAAVTGLLTSSVNRTVPSSSPLGGGANSTQNVNTLSKGFLRDITSQVGTNGHVNLTFPADARGVNFTLFTYYLVHTENREQQTPSKVIAGVPQSPITTFWQNGSWVVDHFSAQGAQVVTNFWQNYLLNGSDTAQLLKDVGNYVWEDSQEFHANIFWTPNLPETFQKNRGYSLIKYLPTLFHNNQGAIGGGTDTKFYVTDEADTGDSHVVDYRQTLTELNAEYLGALTKWAHSIGMQSSAQIGYNFPLDMLANIPDVDAPEGESLGFAHIIDYYRQLSGPANLAGKRVISSECGASALHAYQQTVSELLWDVKRSVVGGINNFVFHGYPYTGNYPNTTWPSYTTFSYEFAGMHNRHQPGWDFYVDFMNYTARVQWASQSGSPKKDIAFWLKQSSYATLETQYLPTDLEDAGFTYEYLSPDDFSIEAAVVADKKLAPTRQAFKAIVVRANDTLTISGVNKLVQWAHNGLPIIFSGGTPSNISGATTPASRSHVNGTIAQLTSLENVHVVPYAGLAQSIASLGITPRTSFSTNRTAGTSWYTNWREDNSTGMTYVFIYNEASPFPRGAGSSSGSITFETTGIPYNYDAWTGAVMPVLDYQRVGNSTTIPVSLAGNQTMILGFRQQSGNSSGVHVTQASCPIAISGSNYYRQDIGVTNNSQPCTIQMSNGSHITVPTSSYPPITLGNWSLVIESWTPGANFSDVEGTIKTNSTYSLPSLVPWNEIPGHNLTNVSGRGYYNTTFAWPAPGSPSGATIDFGPVLHTLRVFVNGQQLPPLDVVAAKADLTPYLKDGINTVEAVVATTLGNVLRPMWGDLKTYGASTYEASLIKQIMGLGGVFAVEPTVAQYGLVGDVIVAPYSSITI